LCANERRSLASLVLGQIRPMGNWKRGASPRGHQARRATGAMGEPGRTTRGKTTSAGRLPAAGGAVNRNSAGTRASEGRDRTDWPLGPSYPSIGSGRGRSSKHGSEDHSWGWSPARSTGGSGDARRLGAAVGTRRCLRIWRTTAGCSITASSRGQPRIRDVAKYCKLCEPFPSHER
jgi:hypothetical protein